MSTLHDIYCPCGPFVGVGRSNHSVHCSVECASLAKVSPQEVRNSVINYLCGTDRGYWTYARLGDLVGVEPGSIPPALRFP